jgi:hypothetical protein
MCTGQTSVRRRGFPALVDEVVVAPLENDNVS